MDGSPIPRVVLDTNVRLDLFVFDDPRCHRLKLALQTGRLSALCNPQCRSEWLQVLGYPKLGLQASVRAAAIVAHDRWVGQMPADALKSDAATRLPRCRDPQDQKFLELARDCGAVAVLSRDAELLRMSPRLSKAFGLRVVQPQEVEQLLAL